MLPEPKDQSNTYVEIRPSQIHGLGVFAKKEIPANTCIAKYEGIEMTLKEFREKYGNDYKYTYVLRRLNKIIVGKGNPTGNISHYCNESNTPNVILKKRGLYTLTQVNVNEELLLKYPKNYPRDYPL